MSEVEETYADFSHRCVHESTNKNEIWNTEHGGFDLPHWHFSAEENNLKFDGDGANQVVCNVFIAGTTFNGRWQWSWANTSGDPRNAKASKAVLEFGERKGWLELTTAFQDADEYTGWEYASVTSHLCRGQATYRFAYGEADEYMAYLIITHTLKVNTDERNTKR